MAQNNKYNATEEAFTQFVQDVQANFTYAESQVDDKNNIVVTIKSRILFVSSTDLLERYNAYKSTALPYSERITKTVGYVTKIVKQWQKTWDNT